MVRPLSSYSPSGALLVGNTGGGILISGRIALTICNAGEYPLESRPQIALAALKVISSWSILDSYVARAFSEMVGGSKSAAVAMYQALGSTTTQHETLKAAARSVLTEDTNDLLLALLRLYKKRVTLRNRVAHHLWGLSDSAPNGIILLDPRDLSLLEEADRAYSKISVYEQPDFESAVTSTEELSQWFHDFYFIVGPHAAGADTIRSRLYSEPQIRRQLDALRGHKSP